MKVRCIDVLFDIFFVMSFSGRADSLPITSRRVSRKNYRRDWTKSQEERTKSRQTRYPVRGLYTFLMTHPIGSWRGYRCGRAQSGPFITSGSSMHGPWMKMKLLVSEPGVCWKSLQDLETPFQVRTVAMASNLLAMASNPIAMASNLIAMASNLIVMVV